MNSFEIKVREYAASNPNVTVATVVRHVDQQMYHEQADPSYKKAPPASAHIDVRAEWVLDQPEIMSYLPDRKINAIKECRAIAMWGLKESKDAVEHAQVLQDKGWISAARAAELEAESEAAVASIEETIRKIRSSAQEAGVTLI